MIAHRNNWPISTSVAGAALLLLTACGGNESGSAADRSGVLSATQVKSAMPDGAAMPGWTVQADAEAIPVNAQYKQKICPAEGNKGCEKISFYGATTFIRSDKKANASFEIAAYRSAQAAEAADEVLWKSHGSELMANGGGLDLEGLGDGSHARVGDVGFEGEPGGATQVRVGTALLWVQITGAGKGDIDNALVKDLASLFTERVEQAQSGGTPSTTLSR